MIPTTQPLTRVNLSARPLSLDNPRINPADDGPNLLDTISGAVAQHFIVPGAVGILDDPRLARVIRERAFHAGLAFGGGVAVTSLVLALVLALIRRS